MEHSPAYEEQINDPGFLLSVPDWHSSVNAYDNKRYIDSIRYLLKYLNKNLEIPEEDSFSLKIIHGSVIVYIKVGDGKFSVKAPFVKMPQNGNAISLMRQVAELNFSYLVLSQVIKSGEEFFFEYEDFIENCEPYKVYAILEEICYGADYHDDIFIDKFKAEFVSKPELNYFSEEQKDKAYTKYKQIIENAIHNGEYLESKRWYNSQCDLYAIAFTQIDYIIAPQGILGSDLVDALNGMYVKDNSQIIAGKTKEKLSKLLDYDKTKFFDSLYFPSFLVPIKRRAELPTIQDFFKGTYEKAANSISNGAYLGASLSLLYVIYDLFYRYRVPPEIKNMLVNALKGVSERDWKHTCEVLYNAINEIMKMEKLEHKEPISRKDVSKKSQAAQQNSTSLVKNVVNKIFELFK
ncbi:MAG: hypothetical protein H7A23_24470 [Leptospiraceae bacterium]|nr:hypothetical protein [Leptospiraceae bacterium]MCP5497721.1 hypothetical protein [Leptospiraceae bacterium]